MGKLEQLKQKCIDNYGYSVNCELDSAAKQIKIDKTIVYLRPDNNLRIWLESGFIEFKNVSSVYDYLVTNHLG